MQVKKHQLEPDMEQWTSSKWRRSPSRLYIVTLLILLVYRVHYVKCWAGWSTAGIKMARRNINNLRYADDTTLMAESEEELKTLLMRGEWKSWLKAQHSENWDHGIWCHHSMANRWGNNENSDRLYFGGLQNHCRWWLSQEMKRSLLLGGSDSRICLQCIRPWFKPSVEKIPWKRESQPTPVFLPGYFHAQQTLAGYSP